MYGSEIQNQAFRGLLTEIAPGFEWGISMG
eukprot:COSAG01_NODE_68881_length_263_cov_0.524390_1_plen_29_part_10